MDTMTLDLSGLTDDGDTLDLAGGRMIRLRIEPDHDTSVNDFDCYGRVEWRDSWSRQTLRPITFDGNAEIIDRDGIAALWWQPPADVKRSDPGFRQLRSSVIDLVTYGFRSVGLELCEGTDHYGRPIVTDSTWIGGVDDVSADYLPHLLADLVTELGL